MSEQRRLRQELRQGLHQFVMTMYQSYLETHGEKEARDFVTEAIKEQLGLFMASDPSKEIAVNVIKERLKELHEIVGRPNIHYDEQMYLAEKIDALEAAQEILESK